MKLKKCPFCGGEAKIKYSYEYMPIFMNHTVLCENTSCDSNPKINYMRKKDQAIKAWNTRVEEIRE